MSYGTVAYVPQDDLLTGTLTVRETLMSAANLRCGAPCACSNEFDGKLICYDQSQAVGGVCRLSCCMHARGLARPVGLAQPCAGLRRLLNVRAAVAASLSAR